MDIAMPTRETMTQINLRLAPMQSLRIIWLALLLIANVHNTALAQASSHETILDLNQNWHFTEIDGAYTNGRDTLLCAKAEAGGYVLWNPNNNAIEQRLRERCNADHSIRHLFYPDLGNIKASITGVAPPSCGTMLDFYNTVTFPDGDQGSFYVIERLASPQKEEQYWCMPPVQGGQKFKQNYDEVEVNFVALKDGSLLLFSDTRANSALCRACQTTFVGPVLIRLRSVPTFVWSSGNSLFLVPRNSFPQGFDSEIDNSVRYKFLIGAISKGT